MKFLQFYVIYKFLKYYLKKEIIFAIIIEGGDSTIN